VSLAERVREVRPGGERDAFDGATVGQEDGGVGRRFVADDLHTTT
jgi:hypothetical protein